MLIDVGDFGQMLCRINMYKCCVQNIISTVLIIPTNRYGDVVVLRERTGETMRYLTMKKIKMNTDVGGQQRIFHL